jgi:hypothetical protein
VREIRMLRAMWRELETGLRRLLHGHEGGNPGHSQGAAYGLPRQFPTLPRLFHVQNGRKPRRCHARTVSGLTMCMAERQPRHERESHAPASDRRA